MFNGDMGSSNLPERVLGVVRNVISEKKGHVGLHEPSFKGREEFYVIDCLKTGWVSSAGAYVDRFEELLTNYTGAKYAIATSNGTSALHIALLLAGVEEYDEVLMPSLTFIATANSVSYCKATPHFVDINLDGLGVDPGDLNSYLETIVEKRGDFSFNRQTGRRIRALVPVHVFGHPVDIFGLLKVCDRFNLVMVEDAAESLGSTYHGRHTGNFGLAATLSFNGNKIITTGGGGAILTNDPEIGKKAKHLTTTARVTRKWDFLHDAVGFNYRLPNINAALGCAQMEVLPDFLERKRQLATLYASAFSEEKDIRFISEPTGSQSNYWLNTILLPDIKIKERNAVLDALNFAGITARPSWVPMHDLVMYSHCPKAPLPITQSIKNRLLNLPSSPSLI